MVLIVVGLAVMFVVWFGGWCGVGGVGFLLWLFSVIGGLWLWVLWVLLSLNMSLVFGCLCFGVLVVWYVGCAFACGLVGFCLL